MMQQLVRTQPTERDHAFVYVATDSEQAMIDALLNFDEVAFAQLVDIYHASLLRMALCYVPTREIAEEVVQETWLAVLRGLARFERRSSFKTWLFTILTNRAQTRGKQEQRTICFSDCQFKGQFGGQSGEGEEQEDAMPAARFYGAGHELAGEWMAPPHAWGSVPEHHALQQEIRQCIEQGIAALPTSQRTVINLRDLEGWSAEEVCAALALSEANQRVLLHRARAKVRSALEHYFAS
jgi:RNA polymerase sigma-70 factor, ECF subfamily